MQSEVAANQSVAFAVLLDALLPISLGRGIPSPHAIQLRGGSIQSPVASFDISTREIGSPFENVADLIDAMPCQPDERLGWLLSLDTRDVDQLLAACTGALIDATQGKFAEPERLRSADRIARAVALDMRQHWEGGIEFYDRLTRKTALAALTEACGPSAAENCTKLTSRSLPPPVTTVSAVQAGFLRRSSRPTFWQRQSESKMSRRSVRPTQTMTMTCIWSQPSDRSEPRPRGQRLQSLPLGPAKITPPLC
jgi:ParB family chromosome partitioning protein